MIGDPAADYVNASGHVLAGPEFLTVFERRTGAALDTIPYEPARHPTNPPSPTRDKLKAVWADGNGNRSERYLAGVAYLDGTHPSLIMARGYYTRTCLAAYTCAEANSSNAGSPTATPDPNPTALTAVTLMHDPQYRCAIAWQNVAYNQPPHPSVALDPGLPIPARREVTVVSRPAR